MVVYSDKILLDMRQASSGGVGMDKAQTSMRLVVQSAAKHVSNLTQQETTRRINSCKREEGSNLILQNR